MRRQKILKNLPRTGTHNQFPETTKEPRTKTKILEQTSCPQKNKRKKPNMMLISPIQTWLARASSSIKGFQLISKPSQNSQSEISSLKRICSMSKSSWKVQIWPKQLSQKRMRPTQRRSNLLKSILSLSTRAKARMIQLSCLKVGLNLETSPQWPK